MVLFSGAERGLHGEIEARQEAFARLLVDAVRQPGWDEILIVGHSMGCQLAVRALGQAVRLDPMFGKRGTPVSLLTLGKSFPLYSMMTDDPAYQRDFEALIEARHIPWIDITSRPDPGSAGHVHPLIGLGLGVPSDRPVRRTPRFHANSDSRDLPAATLVAAGLPLPVSQSGRGRRGLRLFQDRYRPVPPFADDRGRHGYRRLMV